MNGSVPTGRPPTRTTNAMVTTPHTVASSAALDALRRGGSAVDAAIAANAVLCVAYPHMAGLGGDGFWLIHGPDDDRVRAINASGPAGENATRSWYANHEEIPARGTASALTVPGAVDGWRLAHEAYGRLSWNELFTDAIDLARNGVVVTTNLARWFQADQDVLSRDDRAAAVFLDNGTPPAPGERLVQSDLADSLTRIADSGPRDGFYEGEFAAAFCEGLGEGSPLTPTDFRSYEAEWVEPLSVDYRGYTVHGLPPNTQGIAALQILGLLDGFDVTAWGDGTVDYYHGVTEAIKLAFADRDAWVTDPDFVDIPTDELLSTDYLAKRRSMIDFGDILPPQPDPGIVPPQTAATDSAEGDTCYFAVVDEDGLAVSAIQSIYYDFGSGVVAGDTGVIPQNRGSYFSLDPTHVNCLEPGKRSFHTLIPAMLTNDGEPWLVYGTMGGEGQPQTQTALVTRIVDFDYNVQQAIEAPRWVFGRTWGADTRTLSLEGRVQDSIVDGLEARGHPVTITRDYDDTMGHAGAIRCYDDGTLEGGADPRGDGAAIGY